MSGEYFEASSKILPRGRGMAKKSLDLIEAMRAAFVASPFGPPPQGKKRKGRPGDKPERPQAQYED